MPVSDSFTVLAFVPKSKSAEISYFDHVTHKVYHDFHFTTVTNIGHITGRIPGVLN